MNQKFYIIGAGAVGKALAVCLKKENKDVVIIRGSVEDKSHYEEKITVVLYDGSEIEATVEVSTLSNISDLSGIIVLTNKSYGNEALAQKLKEKTGHSPIVILQNGLGVEQPFINAGFPEIYRCVLFVFSQYISENKISYKTLTPSAIGVIQARDTELKAIVDQINSVHFGFRVENNIQKVIWEKAIVNSVFNSICPLLETDNGIFYRDEGVMRIAKRVIKECVSVANASGIDLTVRQVEERVLVISKSSDGKLISTLQDIMNKRETEIDTLNFEIARIAGKLNIANQVSETSLLGELTKFKSELSRGTSE